MIQAFLLDFAKNAGVEAFKDPAGNIVMRKPATPGMENKKGVILQAHMDMVPQKSADTVHDFLTDPIETRVLGEWVGANGTTLGADNGIGIALALSVLQDKTLRHGPLEVLVTYDEETGMSGAIALEPGVLKGDILLNLDSEGEGVITAGCAGGTHLEVHFDAPAQERREKKGVPIKITVSGLTGGHSGEMIGLGRASAIQLLGRVLAACGKIEDFRLISVDGGSKDNAIPREAAARILFPTLIVI